MNQAQQVDRAERIGRSASHRIATYKPQDAPSGDLAATYVWAIIVGMNTIAMTQETIGMRVSFLRKQIRMNTSRLAVSELLALVRLSNQSVTDYFAIGQALRDRSYYNGHSWTTVPKLSDYELWTMVTNWSATHGRRCGDIIGNYYELRQAEQNA